MSIRNPLRPARGRRRAIVLASRDASLARVAYT